MTYQRRRTLIALAGAASLALTIGLSGCSSDSTSTQAVAAVAAPGADVALATPAEPVRVGVSEFAQIVTAPGVTIVDVRTPQEFAEGHIEGAINIPVELPDFMSQVSQLDPSGTYAVYCRSGNRSQPAVAGMESIGITGIYELESGTVGWAGEGQPLVR
jgi:phage shock protein E